MSYLVLARKYRPRTFAEVSGQEVLTGVLRGAIEEGRIGHAYLFSGPRGTGKTTTARIFAKALNCEKGPATDPCNACERCREADTGSEVDIVEIDAASNTSVEFIRDLRDQAAYVPLRARHKIYIIDEVHMLSKAAFNALLKTLEEPPAHVKFLFATTELHKVPETVLSRCQVLRLAALPEAVIAGRLESVFASEAVEAEPGVALELARRARGGMRDALSLADQLLALVGTRPTQADLARLSGGSPEEWAGSLIAALEAHDAAAVLRVLPPGTGDEDTWLAGLLERLRLALICAHCGAEVPLPELEPAERERHAQLGRRLGTERLELWLQELLLARERMRLLPGQARLVLEVALLDLCRPENSLSLAELEARLRRLEARLGGAPPAPAALAPAGSASARPARARSAPSSPPATPTSAAAASATSSASASQGSAELSPPASPGPAPSSARATFSPSAPGLGSGAERTEPATETDQPGTEEPPESGDSEPQVELSPAAQPSGRALRSSTAETWKAFLRALAESAPALAQALERRGQLIEQAPGSALVKLSGLRQQERSLLFNKRNQKACDQAFSQVVGEAISVKLQDPADAKPGQKDPFTRQVADLFGGRIEDES